MYHHYEQYLYHMKMAERFQHAYHHHIGLANFHYQLWQEMMTGRSPLPLYDGTSAIIVDRKIKKPNTEVVYPFVEEPTGLSIRHKINKHILDTVHGMLQDEQKPRSRLKQVSGTYEVKTNRKGVLSLFLEHHAFTKRADVGEVHAKCLTFSLDNGREYAFYELFRDNSGFLEAVNCLVKKQIEEKDIPMCQAFTSLSPKQDYYVTPSSLVVYFPLGEYTQPSYGLLEFYIPLDRLQEIIAPKGPLHTLLLKQD